MTRSEVYGLIDGERDYQEKKWPGRRHSATEFMVYIRSYVNEALEYVSRNDGEALANENMRPIAALAVRAMEQNGAPARKASLPEPPKFKVGDKVRHALWPNEVATFVRYDSDVSSAYITLDGQQRTGFCLADTLTLLASRPAEVPAGLELTEEWRPAVRNEWISFCADSHAIVWGLNFPTSTSYWILRPIPAPAKTKPTYCSCPSEWPVEVESVCPLCAGLRPVQESSASPAKVEPTPESVYGCDPDAPEGWRKVVFRQLLKGDMWISTVEPSATANSGPCILDNPAMWRWIIEPIPATLATTPEPPTPADIYGPGEIKAPTGWKLGEFRQLVKGEVVAWLGVDSRSFTIRAMVEESAGQYRYTLIPDEPTPTRWIVEVECEAEPKWVFTSGESAYKVASNVISCRKVAR